MSLALYMGNSSLLVILSMALILRPRPCCSICFCMNLASMSLRLAIPVAAAARESAIVLGKEGLGR